jgi:tetratricopeptide (TPR) repeat protein
MAQDVIISRQLSQQGMEAMHQGQISEAEGRFMQAIEHCPTNSTARYQLANCLWQRGARQDAIEQLTRAIDLSGSEDVEMMVELGYMWANVGQLGQAMALAEQAIRVAPQDPTAWQLSGDVLRERQDWQAALACYHRSLTYDQNNLEAQLSVAEVYHQMERPARVLATLHRLEDQLPASRQPERAVVLKSLALEQLERYEEAVQVLAQAQRERRRLSPAAMVQLAHAQVSAGRLGEAQQTISKALPEADSSERASLQRLLANVAQRRSRTADPTRR